MENTPEIKTYPWPERTHGLAKPICYCIDDNGCWIVTSHAVSGNGYPTLQISRHRRNMHHHIWEHEHGRREGKGLVIRHLCNNKLCINPAHLREGTHKENMLDSIKAGTVYFRKGEAHPQSKLTEANVRFIRANRGKLTQSKLGEMFGVSGMTISHIQSGKTWGWLRINQSNKE